MSSEAQLQKVLSIRGQTALEKLVVMDAVDGATRCACPSWNQKAGPSSILELEAHRAAAVSPDDLATIIYTSGTTGTPKGVMLTHGNMASNLNCSLAEFPVQPGDVSISFLPLSHVTARHVDFALLYRGVTLAHLALVNQLAAGAAGSEAYIFCCGAASVRKNTFSNGAEGAGVSQLDFL